MPIEIRPVETSAEAAQHGFISAYAFDGDRGEEAMALREVYYQRDWLLAAFDGAEIVAGLVIVPFEQLMEGARIPLGGIASVSCLPERRREGIVGALLREALSRMRDQGQCLSGLYTPHPALYRRYGWETASRLVAYSFPPKQIRPRLDVPAGGRWRRVAPEAWAELDRLHRRHYAARNGALLRDERRWRNHIFSDYGKGTHDAAVWSDAAGEDRAYVVYRSRHLPVASSPFGHTTLRVIDWCATQPDAYAAVIAFLASHDLADTVLMLAGADEPFAHVIADPSVVKEPAGAWHGMMLRVVDVPAAMQARPARNAIVDVTVAVTDAAAPWNAGSWRIRSDGARVSCEPHGAGVAVSLDAGALAAMYNGFVRPVDARRAGLLRADDDAVEALSSLFETRYSPHIPDDF